MVPAQLTFHGIQHSEALADYVQSKYAKLAKFEHPHARIVIEQPHKSTHSHNAVRVRIDLGSLVIDRQGERDAYAAVDAAFDDADRVLREEARRQRTWRRTA